MGSARGAINSLQRWQMISAFNVKVKAVATEIGFAADMKEYKANPEAFGGNVADVSMFIRVAVTGKTNAPDLYTVMQILGESETIARIDAMLAKI